MNQTGTKKVVVLGGAGYLGSVLVPLLIEAGYAVSVIDRFFFGRESLTAVAGNCELIEADTRWCAENIFDGAYAVLDLAALSNDPTSELDPERTYDINFHARVRNATLAKAHGVERYILASSCSVYGFQEGLVDETATPAPITTYAKSSLLAEEGILALADGIFSPTALRQGTLYGLSPRMRFDIVVNAMTLALYTDGAVTVRGGEQWRPLVHVRDSANAFLHAVQSPIDSTSGAIFNVGKTNQNFKVSEVAENIISALGIGTIVMDTTTVDTRSYRVSSDRIRDVLGFVTQYTPQDGALEIYKALKGGFLTDSPQTKTIDWYKQLLAKDPDLLNRHFT